MITVAYDRAKLLRWAWTALAVTGAVWFARAYRPRSLELAARRARVEAREARVRQARAAVVLLGPAGLDSAVARFRADSALLALRVPPDSAAPKLAAELRAVLGSREGAGLRVLRTDPLPGAVEGPFRAGGYAVSAAGRYAAVRGLLADLAAHPRLLRVRALRLCAVPDSLVSAAHPLDPAAPLPGDTAFAPSPAGAPGAGPFQAVVSFQVVWYTRADSPAGDSVRRPQPSSPSGPVP